jgi:amidohydrolase
MMNQEASDDLRVSVARHASAAVALSDDLAAHPELSAQEFESSRKMADLLASAGYDVESPYCGYPTAFRASLDNGEGASVGILAEYDALPEIGHACGHNVHGTMSVLAGLALRDLRKYFQGKIFIIGTPAEEMDGAKIGMAKRGVFDELDLAMMFHCCGGGIGEPAMNLLALSGYDFTFKGCTAHAAASPWAGRNALAAARKFLDLVDARRQCFTPDVRANGIFTDGGLLTNIIPDRARVRLEVRGGTSRRLDSALEGVLRCARGAALALDCDVEWNPFLSDFADMVRNRPAEETMRDIVEALGFRVSSSASPAAGSSDMGNVSYRCPAIQPLLPITDESFSLPTPEFAGATIRAQAHDALLLGAEALGAMALRVLNDPPLREAIREDFLAGRTAAQGGASPS